LKSQPIWTGKSDLDQLFLISKSLGKLLPRHMLIFKANEFFTGSTIPIPTSFEPLEEKFPEEYRDTPVLDFLKVRNEVNQVSN